MAKVCPDEDEKGEIRDGNRGGDVVERLRGLELASASVCFVLGD